MPGVVLRHPDLPGLPAVIDVARGDYVPESYRTAGWDIDLDTSVEDALAEAAETSAQAAAALVEQEADDPFVPSFPPVDDATPAVTASAAPAVVADPFIGSKPPAAPVNPPSAPADLDLLKGN